MARKARTRPVKGVSFNSGLRRLPLFDEDLYLSMQATNLQVVDHILRDMESQLLARYIEILPYGSCRGAHVGKNDNAGIRLMSVSLLTQSGIIKRRWCDQWAWHGRMRETVWFAGGLK